MCLQLGGDRSAQEKSFMKDPVPFEFDPLRTAAWLLIAGVTVAFLVLGESLTVLTAARHGLGYGRIRLWGSLAFVVAAAVVGQVLLAFPVDAVDTTGAGDAFHAGAAWGLVQGMPWEECLVRGAAVAACQCRVRGARGGLPSPEAVAALRAG